MNFDRITIEPGKRSGQPCIRGLRITVYDVLAQFAAGATEQDVLQGFPELQHEDPGLFRPCRRAGASQRQGRGLKLLLDENLSRRLVLLLQSYHPETTHVCFAGLERATDAEIRVFAADLGYVIATRDSDFNDLAVLRGAPPQISRLRIAKRSRSRKCWA